MSKKVDFTGLADLPDNFDLSHLHQALRLFDGRGVAIDVGAHRGIWSREMAVHFRTVFAFEPTQLAQQINPGNAISNIRVSQLAISDHVGQLGLKVGTENTGQTHTVKGCDVACHRLDDLFPNDSCDFIKIDVEGAEVAVIDGAAELIKRTKPAIMLEENNLCTRYGKQPQDVHNAIIKYGYELAGRWNKDYLYLPC